MTIQSKNKEYKHFSRLANEWWLKNGKFKILHDLQPIRIKYIQETLKKKKLNNIKILDVGCGGGLISEEICNLGASVTGVDFVEENIKAAKVHASKNNLKIKYLIKDFEKEKMQNKFDVIIIFEVLEHLNNWETFLKKIKSNLKKRGVLLISTINRNLLSKFFAIDIAENFLKWVPINTHNYNNFIKPRELEIFLLKENFNNIIFNGLIYDPIQSSWKLSSNTKINYFCSCILN